MHAPSRTLPPFVNIFIRPPFPKILDPPLQLWITSALQLPNLGSENEITILKWVSSRENDKWRIYVTGWYRCIVLRMRIALCNRVGCIETVVVRVLWWSCHYILRIE